MIHEHNTWDDIQKQILSSGVNSNLDLLMAGPVPPNPGELITRPSLDDIIKELKEPLRLHRTRYSTGRIG